MKSKSKIQKLYSYFSWVCLEYSVIQKKKHFKTWKERTVLYLSENLQQQWRVAKGIGQGFTLKELLESKFLHYKKAI